MVKSFMKKFVMPLGKYCMMLIAWYNQFSGMLLCFAKLGVSTVIEEDIYFNDKVSLSSNIKLKNMTYINKFRQSHYNRQDHYVYAFFAKKSEPF